MMCCTSSVAERVAAGRTKVKAADRKIFHLSDHALPGVGPGFEGHLPTATWMAAPSSPPGYCNQTDL